MIGGIESAPMREKFSSRRSAKQPETADVSDSFTLSRNDVGQLIVIDLQGRRSENVEPIRAFPITDPDHWISLCDSNGHELATILNVNGLAPEQRELLVSELTRREFVPVIRRIQSISSMAEPCEWIVETDRGSTKFVLNSDEHVRKLGPHKALILDSNGLRYLVPDATQLDAASSRLLARYLT